MSNYSNHDRRGLHVKVTNETAKVGAEAIINNLGDPTIFGGRVFVHPWQQEKGDISFLNSIEFGGTYLADINPNSSLIPDIKRLLAGGIDIKVSPINNKELRLDLYNDLVFLDTIHKYNAATRGAIESTIGNSIGIGLSFSDVTLQVEFRLFEQGFQPTLFDYSYDTQKDVVSNFEGIEADEGAGSIRLLLTTVVASFFKDRSIFKDRLGCNF